MNHNSCPDEEELLGKFLQRMFLQMSQLFVGGCCRDVAVNNTITCTGSDVKLQDNIGSNVDIGNVIFQTFKFLICL